ncbi:MAG: hypothetical protein ABSG64_14275 [Solirubrobacteraceae bacterium]
MGIYKVRPGQVDLGNDVYHLTWGSWTSASARGHGVSVTEVMGFVERWKVDVVAARVRRGTFTRLTVVVFQGGRVYRSTLRLQHTDTGPDWY